MVYCPEEDSGANIGVIGEQRDNLGCSAVTGGVEKHAVAHICSKSRAIEYHPHTLGEDGMCVSFLLVERKQHKQNVESIYIGNSRSIEEERTAQHITNQLPRQVVDETTDIGREKQQPSSHHHHKSSSNVAQQASQAALRPPSPSPFNPRSHPHRIK